MIGKTLGTFTLEAQIGKGSMGEVYREKDQKLRRMERSNLVLVAAILCLFLGVLQSERSFAKDPKITPEEVIAEHLAAYIEKCELIEFRVSRD